MKNDIEKLSINILELQKITKSLREDFKDLKNILHEQFKKDEEELKELKKIEGINYENI